MKREKSITRAGLGALAVAGALAASLASPAVASAEYLGYPALHEGQWYVSSGLVDWSEERGVINGVDGAWLPDGPVDRAQAAAILFNYSGDAAPSEGATFDDAGELGWAAAACAWAQDEGVFNGSRNADGTVTMDPWARLSREQAAAVLHNMSGEAAGDPASLAAFPDGGEVSAWAQGAVAWAVEGGVMGNNGEINPADGCTRAEFVAMVKNAFEPEWAPGAGDEPGGGSGGGAGEQPGTGETDPEPDEGEENPGGGETEQPGGDTGETDPDEGEEKPGGGEEPGTNPGGGSTEQPGDDGPVYDAYDISGPGYRIVERGYMTEDGEMGGCKYNGHKMYNYFPETNVMVFDPDGKQLLSEGSDNPGEDEFRSTASIDYDNDTITYTVTGLGRYHGTASITVGFSRFSSVYLTTPKCRYCDSSCDAGYYGSFPSVTQLYAYRCVDSGNATLHNCEFCEGKLMSELLIDNKGMNYDQKLASDQEVLAQDLYCTNPSCSHYKKKTDAYINVNEMSPIDSTDLGRLITFH